MDHALESVRRSRFAGGIRNQTLKLVVEIVDDAVAQGIDVDIASAHDANRIAVVDKRQQQVLKRRIFVFSLIGIFQCAVKGGFQIF